MRPVIRHRLWCLEAGSEVCESCGRPYRIEVAYYCIDCDRPLCPFCAVFVREEARVHCPQCADPALAEEAPR